MEQRRKVNFAVVGAGRIGSQYIEILNRGLANVNLAGFYTPDEAQRADIEKKLEVRGYRSHSEYLSDPEVEGVIIASPSPTHEEIACDALNSGKDVLLEKPMALSLDGAERIIRTAVKNKRKLTVSFPERFHPAYGKLHDLVRGGQLGRLISVSCKRRTKSNYRPEWYWDQDGSGGVLLDLACHDIDLVRWITGCEIETVAAVGCMAGGKKQVVDNAVMNFTLSGGAIGNIESSWMLPDHYPAWGDIRIDILGTEGMITADTGADQPVRVCCGGTATDFIHPADFSHGYAVDVMREGYLGKMTENFADVILGRKEPFITAEDGIRAMEAASAAMEAMKEKKTVSVGERCS